MDKQQYRQKANRQLDNNKYYKKIPNSCNTASDKTNSQTIVLQKIHFGKTARLLIGTR